MRATLAEFVTALRHRLEAGARHVASRRWLVALLLGTVVLVGSSVLFAPAASAADAIKNAIVTGVGWIATTIVSFLGMLILMIIPSMIAIASYNNFVTAPAVGVGWVIVRDIVNMFFVLIMLVLAFGTILGVDRWSIKGGNLTRLLIMAVVINFSRTLCGLMIDLSQIIMLTFVSGFKEAAGGNFIDALKLNQLLQDAGSQAETDTLTIVVSLFLAVILAAGALFIILMLTINLVIRIVTLWMLVILSPIAFFAKGLPGSGSSMYGKWWSQFTEQLVGGPTLAFFLWLTLVSVQQGDVTGGLTVNQTGETMGDAVSAAFNSQTLATYLVGCGMLYVGYKLSQEIGGSSMGMAASATKSMKRGAQRAAGWAARKTGQAAWGGTKMAAGAAAKGVGSIQLAAGKQYYDEKSGKMKREKVAIGALAGASYEKAKQGLVTSKAGRFIGLDKEYSEGKKTDQMIRAYEATGQGGKASALKTKALADMSTGLKGQGMTGDRLREEFASVSSKDPGSLRHKALMMRMAEEGEFKGRGSEIARQAGNDKDLKKMMVEATVKAGGLMADIDGSRDDAQDLVHARWGESSPQDRTKLARQAADGTRMGPDGKIKDELASMTLQAVDGKTFAGFGLELKKKLKDAMQLAVVNAETPEARQRAERARDQKLGEWDGAVGDERSKYQAQLNQEIANAKPENRAEVERSAADRLAKWDKQNVAKMGTDAELRKAQDIALAKEQKTLVAGGNIGRGFKGYDAASSSFGKASDLDRFRNFSAASGNARNLARTIKPDAMVENGGKNDVALAMYETMDHKELTTMAQAKDGQVSRDNVFAALQAARGIASMSDAEREEKVTGYASKVKAERAEALAMQNPQRSRADIDVDVDAEMGISTSDVAQQVARYRAGIEKARENATTAVLSYDNGTLGAAAKRHSWRGEAQAMTGDLAGRSLRGAAQVATLGAAVPVARIASDLKAKVKADLERQLNNVVNSGQLPSTIAAIKNVIKNELPTSGSISRRIQRFKGNMRSGVSKAGVPFM